MAANGASSPEVQTKREERSRSRSPIRDSKDRHHGGRDSGSNRDRQQRGSRSSGRDRDDRRRSRAPCNRRVYVANIPYDCKWTEMKDLFREKVGDVSYVELFEDENGRFRGCGIVELKDASSVQKAIDVLHRYEIKGRQLVVKEDFDVERDKHGRPVSRSSSRSGGGSDRDRGGDNYSMGGNLGGNMGSSMNPQFNTYGLSPQFLESLGISGPLTNKVFVANLDYKVTTKKLHEIFKMAGKVMNVDLKTDEDGNSKGHGTIEFDHPVEAVQAISMFNGQKLFSRTMSVRMDKYGGDEGDGIPSKLPSGLSGVGKGLGAGGSPIQLSKNMLASMGGGMGDMGNAVGGVSGLGGVGMGNMGVGMGSAGNLLTAGSNLGLGSMGNTGGLAAMGMGMSGALQERGMLGTAMGSNLGTGNLGGNMGAGLGLGGAAGGLGLGNAASTGLGMGLNASGGSLMGSGLGGGLGTSNAGALGTSMTSGMAAGLGSGLGASAGLGLGGSSGVGGSSSLSGYNDYDRGFDQGGSGGDSYRSSRTSDTIIVRNLPSRYTWQSLRDRFRDIGDVRYTEMKSQGTAMVRFNSERDAQRAVDLMHGSRIDGRDIEVRLY